jgi:hypothetical protein
MANDRCRIMAFLGALAPLLLTVGVFASELPVAVDAIATRLDQMQIKEGPFAGDWGGEWGFNGSVVAGMVDAYEQTGNVAYKTAALLGGEFILNEARGVFMGDEIYALVRLSEITTPPESDRWRGIVTTFFDEMLDCPCGVNNYASLYLEIDPSTAVFYLAHFAVAAHRVDAKCLDHWRQVVTRYLSRVGDETSSFPVMALGVATWALATTGELDDTFIGSYGNIPYWKDVVLSDLPALLAGHQVPQGEPFGGSFYWRFDHTFGPFEGPVAGYTEDTIYGALGVAAAASAHEGLFQGDMQEQIRAVYATLLDGVDADGKVYEHLSREGRSYHAFAGEMLQGLRGVKTYLDMKEAMETTEATSVVGQE